MTAVAEPVVHHLDLPIADLHPHPLNRKHFDKEKLEQLEASIRKSGVLTDLLVRPYGGPHGEGYQILAGERRWMTAKKIGLEVLSCKVRDLSDEEAIEFMVIENLQREDVHPLEEAEGYAQLMKKAMGYDVARIAAAVGKSEKYVYDRMKLLQLTPEAKKLFFDDKMTAGHAILLARLSPTDQARAIESDRSGNWNIGGLFVSEMAGEFALEDKRKPVSVREFQHWIDDHVRFKPEEMDPVLFPETAGAIQSAHESKLKIVKITREYRVPDEARDESERTYGEQSWKRADGESEKDVYSGRKVKSQPCDFSVLGVVVAGRGRGEAFFVCINKKKCAIHWPEEKRAADAKAEAEKKVKAKGSKADPKKEAEKAKLEAQKAKLEQQKRELEVKIEDTTDERVEAALASATYKLDKRLLALAVAVLVERSWGHLETKIKKVAGFSGQIRDSDKFAAHVKTLSDGKIATIIALALLDPDHDLDVKPHLEEIAGVSRKAILEAVTAELIPKPKVQTSGPVKKKLAGDVRRAKAKKKAKHA